MKARRLVWFGRLGGIGVSVLAGTAAMCGCGPTEQEKFRQLNQQITELAIQRIELQERLGKRDATIEGLEQQLANLRARGQAPPAPLFDIDRIEILGITSGTDLDGDLVDDAATVYFRPLDRVGDVVKRGGEITIKLFDHAFPGGSRQVGYLHVSDSDQIRRCWYGKFWTNHYKVVVPFAPGADLRAGQEVDIYVRFLDLSTGRPFTARKVIKVDVVNPDETVEP